MKKTIVIGILSVFTVMMLLTVMVSATSVRVGNGTSLEGTPYADAYDSVQAIATISPAGEANPIYANVYKNIQDNRGTHSSYPWHIWLTVSSCGTSDGYGSGTVPLNQQYSETGYCCYNFVGMGSVAGITYSTQAMVSSQYGTVSDTGSLTVKLRDDRNGGGGGGGRIPIGPGRIVEIYEKRYKVIELPWVLQFTAYKFWMQQNPNEAGDMIDDYIQNLPNEAFKNNPDQRKHALSNKLDAVKDMFLNDDYDDARDKLEHDLLAKMDGSSGGNPKNDWIVDEEAKTTLYNTIELLIEVTDTPDYEAMLIAGLIHFELL